MKGIKLDEDLYDYWGVCYRTHEDEECISTFEDVLSDTSPFSLHEQYGKFGITLDITLRDSDKDLLQKYAPKLFNTLLKQYDLHDAILEWATLVHNYRNSQKEANFVNKNIYGDYPTTYGSHKDKKTINAFKNRIKTIYDLMGGDAVGTKKGNDLKKLLKDACENPNDYFTRKPEMKPNKDPIEDYLRGLKLPDKSKVITDFIKDLAN